MERKEVKVNNSFQAFSEDQSYSEMVDSDEEDDEEDGREEEEDIDFDVFKEVKQMRKVRFENVGDGGIGAKNEGKFKKGKGENFDILKDLESCRSENFQVYERKKKVRFEKMPKGNSQNFKKRSPELEINNVGEEKRKNKITIDSGAEESVWPIDLVGQGELIETDASRNDIGFVAANGARMKNYGALKVEFEKGGRPMSMKFHATTVKKPLAAVCRITECGNKVCFGPKPEDNYILNVVTQEQIFLKRERGTYVLEIDAADEESVFTRRE